MFAFRRLGILFSLLACCNLLSPKEDAPKKSPLNFTSGDSEFNLAVKLRIPEFFFSENIRLLNSDNEVDKLFYFRHILDLIVDYKFGKASLGHEAVVAKMNIRNKAVWGDPESIALTTETALNESGVEFGAHRHALPRHIFWIRELFIEFNLADLLKHKFCNTHTVTMGAFPFELGRGISLGSAYTTDATDLGFYAEAAVDQYAFGAKLFGHIIKDRLTYDFYAAILNNLSDVFDNVSKKIYKQAFGRQATQARGFGVINYLLAGRLRWDFVQNKQARVRFEPYVLYNHNPEQRIEFLGDASSNLWTIGLAGEFEHNKLEFGFETAFNFGHQDVKGWDRNKLERQVNKDGFLVIVNSKVKLDSSPALRTSENQQIISTSRQSSEENGQVIGVLPNGQKLINDKFRFSNPYRNLYRGSMIVADGCYYVKNPDFKFNIAFGFASGDEDPNRDTMFNGDSDADTYYEGFIGLQEIYSGTRVKSAFLLAGSGRIPRITSIPDEDVYNPYANTVSRFTNILFTGYGFNWKPSKDRSKFNLNPNILAYWYATAPRIYSKIIQKDLKTDRLDPHLGTEINLFFESELITDLRFFAVGAIFIPGISFNQLSRNHATCLALNKDQKNFIDSSLANPLVPLDKEPLLADDLSYFLNMGLEYRY